MARIEIPADTPALYAQDGKGYDAIVYAHIFVPGTAVDFYVTEYDPEDREIFGWAEVAPGCGELGYTSLEVIEGAKVTVAVHLPNGSAGRIRLSPEIEKDWTRKTITEALAERAVRQGVPA